MIEHSLFLGKIAPWNRLRIPVRLRRNTPIPTMVGVLALTTYGRALRNLAILGTPTNFFVLNMAPAIFRLQVIRNPLHCVVNSIQIKLNVITHFPQYISFFTIKLDSKNAVPRKQTTYGGNLGVFPVRVATRPSPTDDPY